MTPGRPWGQSQSERFVGKWALSYLRAPVMPGLSLRVGFAECVLEGETPEKQGGAVRDEARALGAAVEAML